MTVMKKKNIPDAAIVPFETGDTIIGYSARRKEVVRFDGFGSGSGMIHFDILIKSLQHGILFRSDDVDLSKYKVRLYRKKKKSWRRCAEEERFEEPPFVTHASERHGGIRWTKYKDTAVLEERIKLISLVREDKNWFKYDIFSYLQFVIREPDKENVYETIYYEGCPKEHRELRNDRHRIYQIIGIQLFNENDQPCSQIIQLKHIIQFHRGGGREYLVEGLTFN